MVCDSFAKEIWERSVSKQIHFHIYTRGAMHYVIASRIPPGRCAYNGQVMAERGLQMAQYGAKANYYSHKMAPRWSKMLLR